MAAEKFANRPSTTVASAYTSGATTLVVTSAADFPASGVFRVLLGNASGTIWRVDSVSGDTWTGAAEAFDANAAISDTVKIVASKAVGERFIQAPTAGEVRAIAGVAGADFYGPVHKLADPTGLAWSWVNQGGATIADANGISHLISPSGSTNIHARVLTAPGTPYSITALLRARYRAGATQYGGLAFRESGTGKLYIFYVAGNDALQAVKFTNPTTFSALGPVNTLLVGAGGGYHFIRISDDGTDLRFAASLDGINFFEYGTEGRTVFMAGGPDQVGFFANVDSAAGEMALSLLSWLQG